MIFPWLQKEWNVLSQQKKMGRLPHALLLRGLAGLGKHQFVEDFLRTVFCENNALRDGRFAASSGRTDNDADCCRNCQLLAAKTHPDLLWVAPEKSGTPIKIEQIREGIQFIQQTALQAAYKCIVIAPANNMNTHAANALLKILEEPSPHSMIILISESNKQLPATIYSRCQQINFHPPAHSIALNWLKSVMSPVHEENLKLALALANGAPLKAQQLLEGNFFSVRKEIFLQLYLILTESKNPINVAAQFEEIELIYLFDLVSQWMMDLVRLQLSQNIKYLQNQDFQNQLVILSKRTELKKNMDFIVYLQKHRSMIMQGINLNKLLQIENIFLRWLECCPGVACF